MFIDQSVSAGSPPAEGGGDALAEGMTLLRASVLKLIRLQLAISRNERVAAVEAVDALLALDRRLREYLTAFSAVDDGSGIASGINADRSALNREKLSLSAEILCHQHDGTGAIGVSHDSNAPERNEHFSASLATSPRPKHRSSRWLALAFLLLAALAAVAWAIAGPDPAAWFARASGLIR